MNSLTGKKEHPWRGELRKAEEERHNKENAAMIPRRNNYSQLPPRIEQGATQQQQQQQEAPAIQIPQKHRGESVRIIDYANINRSSGGDGGNGNRGRRRPRVGVIFRSGGSTTSSAMEEESNLDSLELTLQETSKTNTSSSQSTNTTSTSNSRSSPQRRRTTPPRASRKTRYGGNITPNSDAGGDIFEDELAYIHKQSESPKTRSPKYGKLMMEEPPPARQSSNPFSPYGSSNNQGENPFSPYGSSNNLPTTNYNKSSQVPTISRHGGVTTASSSLAASTTSPSSNPFDDIEESDSGHQGSHSEIYHQKTKSSNSTGGDSEQKIVQNRLGLHQLCQEATSPDDIAWRNALYLLAMQPELAQEVDPQGRTPLHVACTGHTTSVDNAPPRPPPDYIIHALLVAYPIAIQQSDSDSRLPIHYMASTSGNNDSFQLLVEAHPASIVARDSMGWTPLHLFLQNPHIIITVPPIQTLLGMTLPLPPKQQQQQEDAQCNDPMIIRQRRGDHLRLNVEHLDRIRQTTKTSSEQQLLSSRGPRWRPIQRYDIPEETINDYPEDVRVCLRRLAQWERKQQRRRHQEEEEEQNQQQRNDNNHNKDSSFLSLFSSSTSSSRGAFQEQERNPAALPAPQGQQLPLHMIILRGLVDVHLQSSRIPEPPKRQKSKKQNNRDPDGVQQRQQHTLIVIVRLLISAYPEGLIARDVNGHTPLLLAMVTAADVLPSQELLELLLGKRTAGYESLPMWAQDVPFPIQHAYTPPNRRRLAPAAERYCNPAIVSTLDTCQLPLHIAAEEWGDHSSLLVAIYESYPGAIHVQDARGRMPLHILLHNYRRITPHPEIVAMLLSERVASTTNDEGQLPFDLLVAAAPFLPKDPIPGSILSSGIVVHPDPYRAFQHFFQPSILPSAVAPRNNGGRGQSSILRRRAEAEVFLWRLRSLPPWLRRQACSASFVQELLLEELASPSKCAFVMAQGFILALLLAAFRLQMDLFIETALHNDITMISNASSNFQFFAGNGEEILNSNIVVEPSLRYEAWNSLAIYGLSAISIGFQAVIWALSGSLNEFQHLCLFNIWRWIDFVAILAAVATPVLIHEGVSDEQVLVVGAVATGMLWCSVIGFLSQWWYGMAFFTGSIVKIVQTILWPALLAAISIVGFAEMFYTIAQVDCSTALGSTSICSLRESYQLVYFLVVGEPVVDMGSPETPSIGMTVLLVLFAALSFLLLLSVLVVVVVVASKSGHSETVALDAYWEPKLALVVSSQNSRSAAARYKKEMWIPQPSRMDRFVAQLDETWGVSACLLFGVGKEQYWYATSLPTLKKLCMRAFLVFVIPIWLVAGLLTFGALWPPQVRRFLFRPRLSLPGNVKRNEAREFFSAQVAGVRNEVVKLKGMSYEQSNDVYQEIQQLKAMIAALSAD